MPSQARSLADRRDVLLLRARDVGVVEAQDESSAVPAREQRVEQRGARIADVERPVGDGAKRTIGVVMSKTSTGGLGNRATRQDFAPPPFCQDLNEMSGGILRWPAPGSAAVVATPRGPKAEIRRDPSRIRK